MGQDQAGKQPWHHAKRVRARSQPTAPAPMLAVLHTTSLSRWWWWRQRWPQWPARARGGAR